MLHHIGDVAVMFRGSQSPVLHTRTGVKMLFNIFQVVQLCFSSLECICLVPFAYKLEHEPHLSWPPVSAMLSIPTSFHGGSRTVYLHLPKRKVVQPMGSSQSGFSNPLSSFLIMFSFSFLNFYLFFLL